MQLHRRRRLLVLFGFLALIIGVPGWLTYRQRLRASLSPPLIAAIKQRQTARVKILLAQGADVNTREEFPQHESLLALFLSLFHRPTPKAEGPNALMLAVVTEQPDLVRLLLANGADVEARSDSFFVLYVPGFAPQTSLSDPWQVTAAKPMGTVFPSYTSIWHTGDRETPLLSAAATGREDILTLLLDHGADIHACNPNGTTVLMEAVAFGKANALTVQMLLDRGAAWHPRNQLGKTALDYARQYQRTALIALLQQAGEKE